MPFLKNQLSSLIGLGYGEQGLPLPDKLGSFFTEPFITIEPDEYKEKKFAKIEPYNQLDFGARLEEKKNRIRRNRARNARNAAKYGAISGAVTGAIIGGVIGIGATGIIEGFVVPPYISILLSAYIGAAAGGLVGAGLGFAGSQIVDTTKILGNQIGLGVAPSIVNAVKNTYRSANNAVIDVFNYSNQSDFLLRNGLNAIPTVTDDVIRIGKFLLGSARGYIFMAKQVLLERQNVKVPSRRQTGFGDLFNDISVRSYNPISTLSQIGINIIGGHVNKQGLNPFEGSYFIGGKHNYYGDTQVNNSTSKPTNIINRLVQLQISKIANQPININLRRQFDISTEENTLISYSGGSGFDSPLGLMKSRIRIWPEAKTSKTIKEIVNSNTPNSTHPVYVFSSDLLSQQNNDENYNYTNTGKITKDFRKSLTEYGQKNGWGWESGYNQIIPTTDYDKFNRENVESGDYYGYGTSKTTFKGNYNPSEEIGKRRIIDPNIPISRDALVEATNSDIITLSFIIINSQNRDNDLVLPFRAYIENWSDNWKADWNAIKYVGRGNPFYKYGGFSRSMQLSFLIPALSRGDMPINYARLNALLWAITPDYSGGLMKGTLVDFKLGNYINDKIIINSIDISEIEGMGWEIDRDQKGDSYGSYYTVLGNGKVGQLPKGIKVNMSITPLMINTTPRWGDSLIGIPYSSWDEINIENEETNPKRIMSQIDNYWLNYDNSDYTKTSLNTDNKDTYIQAEQ